MPHSIAIDANNIFHRMYHVIRVSEPDFTLDDYGREMLVNRAYGFMRNAMRENPTSDVWVCADSPEDSWRKMVYPEYKGNRPTDSSFVDSCVLNFTERCSAVGITALALPGFEADDILYAVAMGNDLEDISTLVITSDSDMQQLLHFTSFAAPVTVIYDPDFNKKHYLIHPDAATACNNMTMFDMDGMDSMVYSIHSNQNCKIMPPYRSVITKLFCGEKGDNIPSCFTAINGKTQSLGETRAKKLAEEFTDIEMFYDDSELRKIASRVLEITNCKQTNRIDEIVTNLKLNRLLIHMDQRFIPDYSRLSMAIHSARHSNPNRTYNPHADI
jgi:5'-3' exonuclease